MYSLGLVLDCCGGCQTFSVKLNGVMPGQRRRAISRGGLRTLSRRGSGVRIRPPVKTTEPPVVGARRRGSANIPSPAPPTQLFYNTRYGCNAKATTIKSAIKTLKAVNNRCNITNPTELKTYLATATYALHPEPQTQDHHRRK